jgi:hypothetical protein
LKIYRNIKSVEDCKSLQADIDLAHQWCGENYMELNIQKIKITHFTRKTNSIHFDYYVRDVSILRNDCIKDFGVMSDSKLHFYVDYVHSQALRILGLISYIILISPL